MKRKFLKLVITLSLSVCFGLGSLVGGVGRQALATSVTESVAAESEVMVEDLDSTSKEFYDFLTKYSDFDSSKLNGEDKKLTTENYYLNDFYFVDEKDKEKILYNVITLSGDRLKNYGNYDFFKNIQVITPTKKGELGTKELNKILQQAINPSMLTKKERK